jgi:hypothetical protein
MAIKRIDQRFKEQKKKKKGKGIEPSILCSNIPPHFLASFSSLEQSEGTVEQIFFTIVNRQKKFCFVNIVTK